MLTDTYKSRPLLTAANRKLLQGTLLCSLKLGTQQQCLKGVICWVLLSNQRSTMHPMTAKHALRHLLNSCMVVCMMHACTTPLLGRVPDSPPCCPAALQVTRALCCAEAAMPSR